MTLHAHTHALLTLLDGSLAAALSRQVQQLLPALGPLRGPDESASEPDGYAGLGRAPHYERLLASEWLLAEEAPDEFLRRAAHGEHAFLAHATVGRQAERHCHVRLECGPDTWGLPRIAMLSALLALELRAQGAGCGFSWSALGADSERHPGISSRKLLQAFLEARDARAAPEEIAFDPGSSEERWLLGARSSVERNRALAHTLCVEELWDSHAIAVTLRRRDGAVRTLRLDMPASDDCVRLLRHPFRELTAAPTRGAAVYGPIVFANRGHRVLTREAQGVVLAHVVPSHVPRARPSESQPGSQGAAPEREPAPAQGRTRRFAVPPGERLLACTYSERIVAITAGPRVLHVYGVRVSGPQERRAGHAVTTFAFDAADGLQAQRWHDCLVLSDPRTNPLVLVPLGAGTTLKIGFGERPEVSVLEQRVLGMIQGTRAHQAAWVYEASGKLALAVQQLSSHAFDQVELDLPTPDELFFCCPHVLKSVGAGYLGVRLGERICYRPIGEPGSAQPMRDLLLPPGATAVGLTSCSAPRPQVVVLEQDGRSFSCLSVSHAEPVFAAPEPVQYATVSPHSATLAFATASHWTLYDLVRRCILARFEREEAVP